MQFPLVCLHPGIWFMSQDLDNDKRIKFSNYFFQNDHFVYFKGNATVVNEMKELNRHSLTALTKFLTKYEGILGHTNHHIMEIKYAIMMMLGNNDNYSLEHLTRDQLEMKENFATQLLELADKIEPGCTKIRGQILLELQMAQVCYNFTKFYPVTYEDIAIEYVLSGVENKFLIFFPIPIRLRCF